MHMRWDVCIYALECCYLLVCHPSFPSADHLCGQVCYFSATVHRRMQTRIERLCMRQHAKDQCRHVNRSSGVLYLCCSCDKMDRLLFFLLSLCFLARVGNRSSSSLSLSFSFFLSLFKGAAFRLFFSFPHFLFAYFLQQHLASFVYKHNLRWWHQTSNSTQWTVSLHARSVPKVCVPYTRNRTTWR